MECIYVCMETTVCKVRMAQGTTKEFLVKRGLRQGDVLSTLLFNLALEKVVRQLPINPGGTILNRQVQVVAYADVAIIARNKRALEENFALLEEKARDFGLEVNRSKTKFMKLREVGEVRGEATVRTAKETQ
jgi:hypothetical protein